MYFDFDAVNVAIDTSQGSNGISAGADTSGYIIMSNADNVVNGHYRFAGISASSYANGSNVHIATMHAIATASFTSGTSSLALRINELSDES
jgi:hypothetical protein